MPLEPDVLSRKSSNVGHTEQVRLSRLDRDFQVLGFVEEGGLWHWLCAGWVSFGIEGREQDRHLLVIPVRYGENNFLIVLA
ncbi:hypothetical protein RRF57_004959 [Xylaria bambusicola]|uniref:Uncharacterized protein n=1 Tax=Xylaria bambusicola TaxID=326684 RepID=A0AAN7UBJ5_9PEZI